MAQGSGREKWIVENRTSKVLAISDLPLVPTLNPGQRIDILRFYSYNDAEKSQVLHSMLSSGWLRIVKSRSNSNAKVERIEESDIDTLLSNLTLQGLSDITGSIVGNANKVLHVNDTETGFEYKDVTAYLAGFTSASSTPYTITDGDNVLLVDASSGNTTVNLPTAASAENRIIRIKKTDSTKNLVTIDADGSETIDGELTVQITSQYTSVTIISDGTSWYII